MSAIINSDHRLAQSMGVKADFDKRVGEDGIEVWVVQLGPYGNINTAFIDRENQVVVLVDPHSAKDWRAELDNERLQPSHIIITHTHRDHTSGVKKLMKMYPQCALLGHEKSNHPNPLSRVLFRRLDYTEEWDHPPHTTSDWSAGKVNLRVTHSPGHAPGHLTFHGHGVYHAGDLLFTRRSGRVDLPGSDFEAFWKSISHAREILRELPADWRMVPGHNYEWLDGSTPNWRSVGDVLEHNLALNSADVEAFSRLDFLRFDDELAASSR